MKKEKTSRATRKPSKKSDSTKSDSTKSGSKKIASVKTERTTTDDSAKTWTFLTNHAHVLIVLNSSPDLVLREVATRVGITERAVQRIVQDLEGEGFVRREKVGRKNQYEVLTGEPLRHPIESHRTIGDLLKLITG